MRRILLGLSLLPASLLATGCSITTSPGENGGIVIGGETQTRYVRDGAVSKELEADWAGQPIEINDAAVSVLTSSQSGVTVLGEVGRTRISVVADVVAWGNEDEADAARAAIDSVVAGFEATQTADRVSIRCGAASVVSGSVSAAKTGCEHLRVLVPAGSLDRPHALRIGLGNGDLTVTGVVGGLVGDSNGAGDVVVTMAPSKGATLQLTGEGAVTLAVPATFAADRVALEAVDSDPVAASNRIDTTAFPGFVNGEGIGAPGTGALLVSLKSKGLLSSDTVTLRKQ